MGNVLLNLFLSNAQNRQAIFEAVEKYHEQHPEDEAVLGLKTALDNGADITSLSAQQKQVLQRVFNFSPSLSLNNSVVRFSAIAPTFNFLSPYNFLPRGEQDTLRQFINANPELGIGLKVPADQRVSNIAEFEHSVGLTLATIKKWGEEHNGVLREPANLEKALEAYRWLDMQAKKNGKRVDIWDYFASIYRRVSKMLVRADSAGQIIVRVPSFMEDIPYEQFSYQTFALAVKNENLAGHMPDSTIGKHARGNVERPSWESLDRYADFLSEQAIGDNDDINHRRDIFEFEVYIRLKPIIGQLIPVFDIANRPVTKDKNGQPIISPLPNYPTRFTLRIVPEHQIIEYSTSGTAAKFDVRFWPFSNIANGHFDHRLEALDRRIKTFETFSLLPQETPQLRAQFNQILEKHREHQNNLKDPDNADPATRTQDYLNKVKAFYGELDRFFKKVLIYTNAQGTLNLGDQSIKYKIVSQFKGVDVAPIVDGQVSVFADDIIQKTQEEALTAEQTHNIFTLRVLTNWYAASGAATTDILTDEEAITNIADSFGLNMPKEELNIAATHLAYLNKVAQDTEGMALDIELNKAIHLRTTGMTVPREYYIHDYTTPWREYLEEHYISQGHSEQAAINDTKAADAYFKTVRHPHYVFNEEKLQTAIADVYENNNEQQTAQTRLIEFFRYINVRINPEPLHTFEQDKTTPENQVIAWAVEDYMEYFPGAMQWGAKVEINDHLLSEVIDRQIAQHPNIYLHRKNIRRGVLSSLKNLNEGHTGTISDITNQFYPLPDEGIFPERFFNFMYEWSKANHTTIAFRPTEVREKLLLAFSVIREKSEDEKLSYNAIGEALAKAGLANDLDAEVFDRLLFDWITQLHKEIEVFKELASPENIEAYIGDKYRQLSIPKETASRLIIEYLKRRLTTPQPVDLNDLIAQEIELGNKFDFYPTIKEQVITFYHKFIRDYVQDTYSVMHNKYEAAIQTVDKIAETYVQERIQEFEKVTPSDFTTKILIELGFIHPQEKTPQIVTEIVNGKETSYEMKAQYHPSTQKIKEFDHQLALLAEALGEEKPSTTLEEHIDQTFKSLAPEVDELIKQQQTFIENQRSQLILAEKPIREFWERVESSLAEYTVSHDISKMDESSAQLALQSISKGMTLVAGFKTEMDGDIIQAWANSADLAKAAYEEDHAFGYISKAETTIKDTEIILGEQKLMLAVQWPLSKINTSYDTSGMDQNETSTSLSQIKEDLALLNTLRNKVEISIFKDWENTPHYQKLADDAKSLIAQVETKLEDEQLQLEIILESLEMEARRTQANTETREIISQANRLSNNAKNITENTEEISEDINKLREEVKSFASTDASLASISVDNYREAWSKMEELREQTDALKNQLDNKQNDLNELNPGEIQGQLANLPNKDILSDQVLHDRTSARKELATTIRSARETLQQAEGYITNLGAEFSQLEKTLLEAEKALPIPALVEIPEANDLIAGQLLEVPNSEAFVAFSVADYYAISGGRMRRAKEALSDVKLLVVGDNSYIISDPQTNKIETWMQDRAAPLETKDVFGTNLTIEAGLRGINLLDVSDNKIPSDHVIKQLHGKIEMLLAKKDREADFIVKLHETSKSSEEANNTLTQLFINLAHEQIETDTDTRLFVRKFALTHAEYLSNMKGFDKSIATWFVRYNQPPLYLNLPEEGLAYYQDTSLDEIKTALNLMLQGEEIAGEELNLVTQEMSEALSPLLSSALLSQWDEQKTNIPPEIAKVWWLAGISPHNRDLLQSLFLYGLEDFTASISARVSDNPPSINETIRFAAKYFDQYRLELKYGSILYDEDGQVRYTFKDHEDLMMIYRWKTLHPDYVTIRFPAQEIGPFSDGKIVIKSEEYERLQEAVLSGKSETIISSYNWKTEKFEDETISLVNINLYKQTPKKDPELEYARLLYHIYNDPKNMGTGYLTNWVMRNYYTYENASRDASVVISQNQPLQVLTEMYDTLVKLLEEYDAKLGKISDNIQGAKNLEIEKIISAYEIEIEKMFKKEGGKAAAVVSSENSPNSILSYQNVIVPTTNHVDGKEIDKFADLGDIQKAHHDAAYHDIDKQLAGKNGLPGWENVNLAYRNQFIGTILSRAQSSPGEQLLIDSTAISYYFRTTGLVARPMMSTLTLRNPFIGFKLAIVK